MESPTGAKVIARALHDLGVSVVHTLVGVPVADIAQEAIDFGIRVIGYRNEQACSYAASAYGYLTGHPGVCLLTGGPGILHGMAGIGNATINAFPLLVLGGSADTSALTKGGFQELDAVALLTPHTKAAIRPPSPDPAVIVAAIRDAYRTCWYGRPGPAFVDLPTDLIMRPIPAQYISSHTPPPIAVPAPPHPLADPALVAAAAQRLRSAAAPLVIIGKGAAYARAERAIRRLVATAHLPFLPTPMGKGVVPDSDPWNVAAARSAALKGADVILVLGARLNWILHFGEAPKFRPDVTVIQVDIAPEVLGHTNSRGQPGLGLVGDLALVVDQLTGALGDWRAFAAPSIRLALASASASTYPSLLAHSMARNERRSRQLALTPTPLHGALDYERAYHIIKATLDELSPPADGGVVLVSEGANTMDISRGAFPLEHPRQRLDAGTWGTMGVGMGYAIAAWAAYNLPQRAPGSSGPTPTPTPIAVPGPGQGRKRKIVALEGDSAFGFSAMEVETMARHQMDIVVIVMNNSGIYKGDAPDASAWKRMQAYTVRDDTAVPPQALTGGGHGGPATRPGLRASSLLYETRYEALADMVGGRGYLIRTEHELARATREAFLETERVCILNVIIDAGLQRDPSLGFLDSVRKHRGGGGGGGEGSKL